MSSDQSGPAPPIQGGELVEAPLRRLDFGVRAEVMGASGAGSWEPVVPPEDRSAVLHRHARCVHCGLVTGSLQLGSENDIHEDTEMANLVAVDPLCHGYRHLGDLGAGNGRLAYVPGIDRTDLNHLQRLIAVQLYHGDSSQKAVANDLMNWLASHGEYVEEAFGTQDPATVASVLNAVKAEYRENSVPVFGGMALVYNPRIFARHTSTWLAEVSAAHPSDTWTSFYNDIRNLNP